LEEQVYAHVKSIGLPFTIIDVGWWYQIAIPKLPSGKADYALTLPAEEIFGTGEQMSALIDLRDIGKYVARVVQDERTINKYVLCYNGMYSQLDSYAIMERLSGETIPRNFVSRNELEKDIVEALPKSQISGMNIRSGKGAAIAFKALGRQYALSWGVHGDNTPQKAKELGYLTSKELWLEMKYVEFEDFLKDVVEGRATPVYEDQRENYQQLWEVLKLQKKLQNN
jgi:hypothetical protein